MQFLHPRQAPLSCIALLVSGLLLAAACTPAEETTERTFEAIGGLNVQYIESCAAGGGEGQLRLGLLDQRGVPIAPGAQLVGGEVGEGSLEVRVLEGWLYPVGEAGLVRCDPAASEALSCVAAGMDACAPYRADVDALGAGFVPSGEVGFCRTRCTLDAECTSGACVDGAGGGYCALRLSSGRCEEVADCPAGFACEPVGEGAGALHLCARPAEIEVTPADFSADDGGGSPQALTLLMDNSGSLHGKGVEASDANVRINRATDPNDARIAASKLMLLKLNALARPDLVALWSFGGAPGRPMLPATGDATQRPLDPFITDREAAIGALEGLTQESTFGRSNVFEALHAVARSHLDHDATLPPRRSLILFTDGPDDSAELPEDATEAQRADARDRRRQRFEDALALLQQARIAVHVVHLDTGIGAEGLLELRPDARDAAPAPRDPDGRFGPLEGYARLACETGGNTLYASDPRALNLAFTHAGALLSDSWRFNVSIPALQESGLPPGAYRFGGVVEVTLHGITRRYALSPTGDHTDFGNISVDDNRGLIFKGVK